MAYIQLEAILNRIVGNGVGEVVPSLPVYADPAWITNYTIQAQDAQGWTVFTPSASTQIIYVDDTLGNDSDTLIYDSTDTAIFADPFSEHAGLKPFKTFAAAMAARRDNQPDWVLFKKGEEFLVTSNSFFLSGSSNTERQLLGSMGRLRSDLLLM